MRIVDQIAWQASPEQIARRLEAAKRNQEWRDASVARVKEIGQKWDEENAHQLPKFNSIFAYRQSLKK